MTLLLESCLSSVLSEWASAISCAGVDTCCNALSRSCVVSGVDTCCNALYIYHVWSLG